MALSLAATASATEKSLSQVIQAMFDAYAGYDILMALAEDADANSIEAVSNSLVGFADNTDSAESFATAIVANLGVNSANGVADADIAIAVDYVTGELNAAGEAAWGETVLAIVTMYSGMTADATYGAAATAFNAVIIDSLNYSLDSANSAPLYPNDDTGSLYYLTGSMDMLTGTAGDDTFIARGNNSLNNEDNIDGGAGTDTIEVMLDNAETAESPLVTNVEILKAQAQARTVQSGDNSVESWGGVTLSGVRLAEPNIDAGDMQSVVQYWSWNSRADLAIEDVSHNSHEVTIGMSETDPDVNYFVFFDEENITKAGTQTGQAFANFELVNVLNLAEDLNVLAGFTEVTWVVNAETLTVEITEADGTPIIQTHADLVDAMIAAMVEQGYVDGTDFVIEAQTAVEAVFSRDVTAVDGTEYQAGDLAGEFTPILITAFNDIELDSPKIGLSGSAASGNLVFNTDTTPPDVFDSLTQTNIVLDRVGKDSEGGWLVIGNDSTPAVSDPNAPGIEQFNVQVMRDSWLTGLASTNNWLEVVNATNSDGYTGNLTIENLMDVRVFNASGMGSYTGYTAFDGNIDLTANLGQEVAEKYLNRMDDAIDPAEDNSEFNANYATNEYAYVVDRYFSYDMGNGDDILDLEIDAVNLQAAGNAEHEDFVLEVNGGAGDDELMAYIWDGNDNAGNPGSVDATESEWNWLNNQRINANLSINGGTGNDTIRTGDQSKNTFDGDDVAPTGSGDWKVDGGDGSDTIYIDNTGYDRAAFFGDLDLDGEGDDNNGNAIWVLNAANTDINNLESNAAHTGFSAVNVALQVVFKGFEVTVDLEETIGSTTNVAIDDLRINQAIKDAINNDAVLSKLLSAEDGPARTLTVQSLIDGQMAVSDLAINIVPSDIDLTAAQTTAGVTPYADSLSTLDEIYDAAAFATPGGNTLDGRDSWQEQDSEINGGEADNADDVIVLGTGANSNDTVVYSGFNNATNFIVNFEDDGIVTTSTTSTSGTGEIYTITFSDATVTGTATISITGTGTYEDAGGNPTAIYSLTGTATLDDGLAPLVPLSGQDIAENFADTFGGAWTVLSRDGATVTIQHTGTGDLTDVVTGDFEINGTTATTDDLGITWTVAKVQDGVMPFSTGSFETFTVDFEGTSANGTGSFTFDGATISYVSGDGEVTLAEAVASATYANWTAVLEDNGNGINPIVRFTANTVGNQTDATGADFNNATDNIAAAVTVSDGGYASGSIITTTFTTTMSNADHIDFTDYGAVAVYVDGVLIEGSAPNAADELYVTLTESLTNDGEYLIELWQDDVGDGVDVDDTLVGVIGVADFGAEQNFTADTFII